MLQFYYDCLDKYVDRSDFQYIEMDTDSAYLALSGAKLDDVIKPHMKEEYEKDKYNWFPNETTKELKAYNKRTPGLFKVEFEGNTMYALCSKLYFVVEKKICLRDKAPGWQCQSPSFFCFQ
jgi:hypothetical protein